jgi:hypothetical protein
MACSVVRWQDNSLFPDATIWFSSAAFFGRAHWTESDRRGKAGCNRHVVVDALRETYVSIRLGTAPGKNTDFKICIAVPSEFQSAPAPHQGKKRTVLWIVSRDRKVSIRPGAAPRKKPSAHHARRNGEFQSAPAPHRGKNQFAAFRCLRSVVFQSAPGAVRLGRGSAGQSLGLPDAMPSYGQAAAESLEILLS